MQMPKLSSALALAVQAHEGQVRKSTNIPYISHPMAVASIALEFGATEDQAIAALLHDAIEDGGTQYANIINEGPSVFNRFSSTTEQTLWYYRQLATVFTNRKTPPAKALEAAVSQMEALSQSAW